MKAVYLDRIGGTGSLTLGEMSIPEMKPDEVLIRVFATAITPTEFQWFPTFKTPSGTPRGFPVVLSHEFSGVIESVGAKVNDWHGGEEIFGLNDWFTNGAQAEYCVTAPAAIAPKPKSISHLESATVPISALTAWQGLFERAQLKEGERILIHGGAGAVGLFAVQLAHRCGAHVIATASSANLEFVHQLGADEVIDYRKARLEDVVFNLDVVFDSVGGETLERSWALLKGGGRVVTVANQLDGISTQRARDAFMLVRADGLQLAQFGNLIDAGKLRVFYEAAFDLSVVHAAYDRALAGALRGKIVLSVPEEANHNCS